MHAFVRQGSKKVQKRTDAWKRMQIARKQAESNRRTHGDAKMPLTQKQQNKLLKLHA
jgi:hypothetical protein